jgi:hypothetical protein
LSTGAGTVRRQDTIFHSPRDTRPLVVRPPTLTAPAADSVIHIVPGSVTLRVTCVAAG